MPWTPIIMQEWRVRIWRTYRGGFGPRVDLGEWQRGGEGVAQGCKTPWNYQQSLPIPVWVDGWNGLCPLRALGPPSNRVFVLSPCLWDSTLLFGTAPESSRYRVAASFRRVSYFKRPGVLVRDFTLTYPRFFLPSTIVFNQGEEISLLDSLLLANWTIHRVYPWKYLCQNFVRFNKM